MKRLIRRYNHLKLGHKLLIVFGLVSIFPMFLLQLTAFQINENNMVRKIDELMVNNLVQISERVRLNLQIYSNITYQIYKDEEIIKNIAELSNEENTHKAVIYNRVVSRLKQYDSLESNIRCICIVCPNGNSVVYDFETDSSLNTIWKNYSNPILIPPYQNTYEAAGMVITDTMFFDTGENQGHFFHISKRLFDFEHLDKGTIGTVIVSVDQEALSSICNSGSEIMENSINFIMNEKQDIICYPDADFTGITMNPDLEIKEFVQLSGFLQKKEVAINKYEDPVTGWIFYNAYDRDYMFHDIAVTQRLQLMLFLPLVLFAVVLIYYVVHSLGKSVDSVVIGMQEVQKGNLDVVIPVQSFREIETIADNFNEMTVKVKQLIQEVSDAKEQQKEAEIRALEAQINPHFLYNTLDSINWMAIEKEEYEISRMLRNLGVILRYSVNKSNQKVSVRELEDWLHKYVSLHQMRFNDAFSCEINVNPETYQVRIYKLLLQPFVENAILHGFKEMEHGGLLRIDIGCTEDQKELFIIIEDNGKGMEPELVKVFNDRSEAIRDDGRSIGLHNAFSRMHMYYGDQASWQVNSMVNMGTVITIRLPIREEETEE